MCFLARTVLAVLVLAAAASCGKSEDVTGASGGGGVSGGGAVGGGGTGATGATGGTGGTAGEAGPGDSESCAGFADDKAVNYTITYENTRSTAVFLPGTGELCGPEQRFELKDSAGLVLHANPGGCTTTCDDFQTTTSLSCDAGCYTPSIVTLAPGGSYTESWDGRVFVQAAMPASCYSVPAQAPAACPRRVVPPAGAYSFSAVAGGTCDACTCTPAGGWCSSPVGDAGVSGESLTATAAVAFPGPTSIKLVFQ